MKKNIITSFFCLILLGCGPYEHQTNPIVQAGLKENERIQQEHNLLLEMAKQVENEYNQLAENRAEFCRTLNDEQLKAYKDYIEFISKPELVNAATLEITGRQLLSLFSSEQFQRFGELEIQEVKLNEQARQIQEKYQILLKQQGENREAAITYRNFYLYQGQIRQRQAQQDWQDFLRGMGEAYKKSQEAPEVIPLDSRNSSYWQERRAKRDLIENR